MKGGSYASSFRLIEKKKRGLYLVSLPASGGPYALSRRGSCGDQKYRKRDNVLAAFGMTAHGKGGGSTARL